MKVEPRTLKGFRDFLPREEKKRQYVINLLREVFESYGFEPLETPAVEYEDILLGKYGEEGDKLMYRFVDNGERRVALRYDQTVPLARVVAQFQNEIPLPFKRYQMQPVWRAENTQKGRFREFLQCDIDTVGVDSAVADAEIIQVAVASLAKLGFKDFKVLFNDRDNLKFDVAVPEVAPDKNVLVVRAIDKIKKIGRDGVINELITAGFTPVLAQQLLTKAETTNPTPRLTEVIEILKKSNVPEAVYEFSPTLARGLDYYTGLIIEVEIEGYDAGAVCGGGRYDNLVGMFAGREIPAVGFAFGFDRVLEAMEQFNLFPIELNTSKILVTVFSPEFLNDSIKISSQLRANNINCEMYLDPTAKMEKQLKYADQKGIPYVVIIGPEEKEKGVVTIKALATHDQKTVKLEEAIQMID